MPAETGSCILAALDRFASLLVTAEGELNALNVFPVADRDTGTNLKRTVEQLLAEIESFDPATGSLGSAIAMAALRAARGNSGLICSQYLASFIECGDDAPSIDGRMLAKCLERGAVAARAAVARPVEGTMLTVADAAADAVTGRHATSTPAEVARLAHRRSLEALAATPDQLPVLAEAGVVDAGAAGLVLFLEALWTVLEDGQATEAVVAHREPDGPAPSLNTQFVGFELQFTADGPQTLADELRTMLDVMGTDVVVSSAQGVVRAHVHVSDVGAALEAVLARTRPRNIVVEALMESTEP